MSGPMRPAFDAAIALTGLDERIARSPLDAGFLVRQKFADACASLWIDGERVHLEDLVLHDATRDIRTPTHEFTIARHVLRTHRWIAVQLTPRALSADGLRTRHRKLRGHVTMERLCICMRSHPSDFHVLVHRNGAQFAMVAGGNLVVGMWKRLAIGSRMDTKRCDCRVDLKRFMIRSRRRIG